MAPFSITGPPCIFSQSSTETVQGHHPLSNDHPLKTAAAPFRQLIFGSGYSRCHAVIYHSDYGNANQFWKNSALSCFQPDAGVSFPDKRCRMTDFSNQKWTNNLIMIKPITIKDLHQSVRGVLRNVLGRSSVYACPVGDR